MVTAAALRAAVPLAVEAIKREQAAAMGPNVNPATLTAAIAQAEEAAFVRLYGAEIGTNGTL